MKTHELAKQLLAGPDVEIVGVSVGQGSAEGWNEYLTQVIIAPEGYLNNPQGDMAAWMFFSPLHRYTEQEVRDNGWLTLP